MPINYWTEQEDLLLKENYSTSSYSEMLLILPNRSGSSIYNRALKKFRLKKDASVVKLNRESRWRYYRNREFFSIPNTLNSYWAGFIAADGYIDTKCSKVSIMLAEKDRGHLDRFCKDVKYEGPIRTRIGSGFSADSKYAVLDVCGVRSWVDDLDRHFNVGANKTKILRPPNIFEEDLVKAYISGYIDGDGSIGVYSREYGSNGKDYSCVSISIVGYKPVLSWIKGWFDSWAETNRKKKSGVVKSRSQYRYSVNGARAESIINKMLGVDVPRLCRKWEPSINFMVSKGYNIDYKFYSV